MQQVLSAIELANARCVSMNMFLYLYCYIYIYIFIFAFTFLYLYFIVEILVEFIDTFPFF